jgi:hypothetical protein
MLRRVFRVLTPLTSFDSLSSGGSESGLDLAVAGLEGGLDVSAVMTVVLNRELLGVDPPLIAREIADEFLARSQKCSYGRITRLYEFLSCVDNPGMPR